MERGMMKFRRFTCYTEVALPLIAITSIVMTSIGMAEQGQVDPAQLSKGLKAIFSYGSATKTTKDHLNASTTTVIKRHDQSSGPDHRSRLSAGNEVSDDNEQ
jgi:hypothetical protein